MRAYAIGIALILLIRVGFLLFVAVAVVGG